ncbi:MAG: hypothetical protein M3Y87_13355 [Myxococcota bacterium]|nr:hypothetical protein [Myxococcota bacterium]
MRSLARGLEGLLGAGVLGAAVLIAGCGGAVALAPDADVGPRDASVPVTCDEFSPGVELGRVAPLALAEISGIAASRAHEGVLWVHNDSGGGARLFAIDVAGALLGEWVLEGASDVDWEDIAIEPVEGGADRLWIADLGDNAARERVGTPREFVVVLRADEPALAAGVTSVMSFDSIVLRYPERPRDCEAIAVDPQSGDLYLFAKETVGASDVFVARAPLVAGEERVLERITVIDTGSMVTAADLSPDGRELLVRTYRSVLWWRRGESETWAASLARDPRHLPRAPEPQGEAVAFARDREGYFTISEGTNAPVWFYQRHCE